jgi:hypothetical protein
LQTSLRALLHSSFALESWKKNLSLGHFSALSHPFSTAMHQWREHGNAKQVIIHPTPLQP